MAVFITNVCKYDGCGITFPSLNDLIIHIEDTHIDYDPKVVEQKEQAQPSALPLSYVLRFISEDVRKESTLLPTGGTGTGVEFKRKLAIKHHSYSISSSNRSNTPTCSEVDEDEMVVTESEDSNDSWTTEEFSSEFIMRYGSRHSGTGSNGTPGNEKPFACPVPGCKKRYKNVNGIKYHSKNGHKKDGKVRKGYKCHCGKSYKTAQGLKNHALATHNSAAEPSVLTQLAASGGGILLPRSASPSQSLGSLSPSSISNMSSSASSCHGSSNANSNNILQHLTNSVGTTVSAPASICGNGTASLTSITANGTGSLNLQISNPQTQPHLQQLAATLSSNGNGGQHLQIATQNGIGAAAVGSELYYPTSTSYGQQQQMQQQKFSISTSSTATTAAAVAINNSSSNNNNNNNNKVSNSVLGNQTKPISMANTSHLHNNHNNTNNNGNNAIDSPYGLLTSTSLPPMTRISPNFIEHKYSANMFKEKFLANLRQANGGGSGSANNSSPANPKANLNSSNKSIGSNKPVGATASSPAAAATTMALENLMIACPAHSTGAGVANGQGKEVTALAAGPVTDCEPQERNFNYPNAVAMNHHSNASIIQQKIDTMSLTVDSQMNGNKGGAKPIDNTTDDINALNNNNNNISNNNNNNSMADSSSLQQKFTERYEGNLISHILS